jgi:hypothetical protein
LRRGLCRLGLPVGCVSECVCVRRKGINRQKVSRRNSTFPLLLSRKGEGKKTTYYPGSLLNGWVQPQHLLDDRIQVRQARGELLPCRIGGGVELGELVAESLLFVWAAAEFY